MFNTRDHSTEFRESASLQFFEKNISIYTIKPAYNVTRWRSNLIIGSNKMVCEFCSVVMHFLTMIA